MCSVAKELNIIEDEEVDLLELIPDNPKIIQDEKEEEKVELPELFEKCALDTHRNTLPKAKAKEDSDEEVLKLRRKQIAIDKAPFTNFLISDSEKLNTVMGRKRCERCHRSRKFFCYTCCLPVIDRSYFPRVKVLYNYHRLTQFERYSIYLVVAKKVVARISLILFVHILFSHLLHTRIHVATICDASNNK